MTSFLRSLLQMLGVASPPARPQKSPEQKKQEDRFALDRLCITSSLDVPHRVRHTLFFDNLQKSANAVHYLREQGIAASTVPDKKHAYVLVDTRAYPTESKIAELRAYYERVAKQFGGEYVGWKAEPLVQDSA